MWEGEGEDPGPGHLQVPHPCLTPSVTLSVTLEFNLAKSFTLAFTLSLTGYARGPDLHPGAPGAGRQVRTHPLNQ